MPTPPSGRPIVGTPGRLPLTGTQTCSWWVWVLSPDHGTEELAMPSHGGLLSWGPACSWGPSGWQLMPS